MVWVAMGTSQSVPISLHVSLDKTSQRCVVNATGYVKINENFEINTISLKSLNWIEKVTLQLDFLLNYLFLY
jgi:hypothetical protein